MAVILRIFFLIFISFKSPEAKPIPVTGDSQYNTQTGDAKPVA